MSTHYFESKNPNFCGVIYLSDIYTFEGYLFENHRYCGPFLCTKKGEPKKRQPGVRSRFWGSFERWQKLTKDEKEATRVHG